MSMETGIGSNGYTDDRWVAYALLFLPPIMSCCGMLIWYLSTESAWAFHVFEKNIQKQQKR